MIVQRDSRTHVLHDGTGYVLAWFDGVQGDGYSEEEAVASARGFHAQGREPDPAHPKFHPAPYKKDPA